MLTYAYPNDQSTRPDDRKHDLPVPLLCFLLTVFFLSSLLAIKSFTNIIVYEHNLAGCLP